MIDDLAVDDRRMFQRRDDDGKSPSVVKWIGIVVVVMGICGSIFTAGYNWRSVSILEANQDRFVEKNVQKEQFQNVNDRLAEISRQLEELRGELRGARRKE